MSTYVPSSLADARRCAARLATAQADETRRAIAWRSTHVRAIAAQAYAHAWAQQRVNAMLIAPPHVIAGDDGARVLLVPIDGFVPLLDNDDADDGAVLDYVLARDDPTVYWNRVYWRRRRSPQQ